MATLHPYVVALEKFVRATVADAGDQESLLGDLAQYGTAITNDPRDATKANCELLRATLDTLFIQAQTLYGEGTAIKRHARPIYVDHPRSKVAPLVDSPDVFAVAVSRLFGSWEAAFYEIAHESIHLLGPVAIIESTPIATLDEGVAVRYAETMYREHITAYTDQPPTHSPLKGLYGIDEPYFRSYQAVKDVTDATLHALRQSFGGFSVAFDPIRILEIACEELSVDQAEVLAAPFDYHYCRRSTLGCGSKQAMQL